MTDSINARQQHRSADFRPDIQGLRAIAVAVVVLYHARLPGFAGGFVGVDVFFVISGFLICGLLAREMRDTGTIALVPFWARRARRLLPNALATLLAVLLIAAVLTPAYRYANLAFEAGSATLYVSNYVFAAKAIDYFQMDAPPSPVLHFWSLSVEEQFYIVWPLLVLALVWTRPRRAMQQLPWMLGVILAVSLAASLWTLTVNQPLAFFHTGTRAWQLASGGLLALAMPSMARLPAWLRAMTSWAGLAAVVLASAAYNDRMSYPGMAALLPSAGAILLLGSGAQVGASTWLGWMPMQWLGARSYSLYLWHWPILVFTAALMPEQPLATLAAVALAIVIASVAYSVLEEPIRIGRLLPAPPLASMVASLAALAFVTGAAWGLSHLVMSGHRDTAKGPGSMAALLLAATKDYGRNYADHCHLQPDQTEQPPCLYGDASAHRRAVLFGDSHAAQWFAPLSLAAAANGWSLNAWTKSSCPSVDLPIWYKYKRTDFVQCDIWRDDIMRRLLGPERPDAVFLTNLTDYNGWMRDRASGTILSRSDTQSRWRLGFAKLLRRLRDAGLRVVVIRDTPQTYKDFADCLSANGGSSCNRPRSEALTAGSPDVEVAHSVPGVEVLDLTDLICDRSSCPVLRNDLIVYRDRHHLTASFSATLAGAFSAIFRH